MYFVWNASKFGTPSDADQARAIMESLFETQLDKPDQNLLGLVSGLGKWVSEELDENEEELLSSWIDSDVAPSLNKTPAMLQFDLPPVCEVEVIAYVISYAQSHGCIVFDEALDDIWATGDKFIVSIDTLRQEQVRSQLNEGERSGSNAGAHHLLDQLDKFLLNEMASRSAFLQRVGKISKKETFRIWRKDLESGYLELAWVTGQDRTFYLTFEVVFDYVTTLAQRWQSQLSNKISALYVALDSLEGVPLPFVRSGSCEIRTDSDLAKMKNFIADVVLPFVDRIDGAESLLEEVDSQKVLKPTVLTKGTVALCIEIAPRRAELMIERFESDLLSLCNGRALSDEMKALLSGMREAARIKLESLPTQFG